MQASRIAELLDPFLGPPDARRLAPDAFERISTYIDILRRWNARINLTAIREEEEIVTRHFGESLFAARHLFPGDEREERGSNPVDSETDRAATGLVPEPQIETSFSPQPRTAVGTERGRDALGGRVEGAEKIGTLAPLVADVGSGAGFPGIPIKLWAPEIALTLIESNHKKATFLRELARTLTLKEVNIQNTRAESLASNSFDVVTLRAVERFEAILPVAASLVAPAGRLALLIGRAQLSHAQSTLPSLDWSVVFPIPTSRSRVLAIVIPQPSRNP